MQIDFGTHDAEPEIGLIALIDCIFFLLMFFMVATSFKQQQDQSKLKHQPIELPAAQVALDAARAAPDPVVIGIAQDGGLFLGEEPVSLGELRERLHEAAARNPAQPVRIDGDRRTPYQNIVHVLDLCQFEHLTKVSLRTRD